MAQEKVRVLLPSQALNISEKLQDRNSAASLTRGQTMMWRDKALLQVKFLRRNSEDEMLNR